MLRHGAHLIHIAVMRQLCYEAKGLLVALRQPERIASHRQISIACWQDGVAQQEAVREIFSLCRLVACSDNQKVLGPPVLCSGEASSM